MKILFLTNIPSPYRMEFFNELGKYCNLTVTFEGRKATDRNEKWIGKKNQNYNAIFMKGKRTKSDQFFCPEIIPIIKRKYDHIIVSNYSSATSIYAIKFMRHHKINFWIEADGGIIPECENKFKYILKKNLISSASHWLSSGEETSKYFIHYGAKENEIYKYSFSSLKKSDILSDVLDRKEKIKIRKKIGLSDRLLNDESKIVVSVGQFIYRKGYDILLKAWKNCDEDASLFIIGGVPSEEYLSISKKLNLKNIHFINFVTKSELYKILQAADLFVLPTREDIWGLVINEAMANGLPIITTNRCIAGLELVKNGENGYIVPVNNISSLSKRIVEILKNDSLRLRMAFNSLNAIQGYTIENMAKEHMTAFKSVL